MMLMRDDSHPEGEGIQSDFRRERGPVRGVSTDPAWESAASKRCQDEHGSGRRSKIHHGRERLAGEIASTLAQVLPLVDDERLLPFSIAAVIPLERGHRFLVQVHSTDPSLAYDPTQVLQALQRAKAFLRLEVARDVHRKFAPDFRFQVLPPGIQLMGT